MAHWTATQATASLVSLLGVARLILVSNREPYSHRWHRQALAASAGGAPAPAGTTSWEGARVRQASGLGRTCLRMTLLIRSTRPAGGLTSALDPVMQACHGTWVAWGHDSADRHTVDAQDHVQVPPDNPQYTLRRIWLSEAQVRGFYYGFANSALWPLCHLQPSSGPSLSRAIGTTISTSMLPSPPWSPRSVAQSQRLSGSRITTWRSARPSSASVFLISP